jgi:hypothetical protein
LLVLPREVRCERGVGKCAVETVVLAPGSLMVASAHGRNMTDADTWGPRILVMSRSGVDVGVVQCRGECSLQVVDVSRDGLSIRSRRALEVWDGIGEVVGVIVRGGRGLLVSRR